MLIQRHDVAPAWARKGVAAATNPGPSAQCNNNRPASFTGNASRPGRRPLTAVPGASTLLFRAAIDITFLPLAVAPP
jgi:hypothetical protein